MSDMGVWPERTLVIALRVKSKMAAIFSLFDIFSIKYKELHNFDVCRRFSRYARSSCASSTFYCG